MGQLMAIFSFVLTDTLCATATREQKQKCHQKHKAHATGKKKQHTHKTNIVEIQHAVSVLGMLKMHMHLKSTPDFPKSIQSRI